MSGIARVAAIARRLNARSAAAVLISSVLAFGLGVAAAREGAAPRSQLLLASSETVTGEKIAYPAQGTPRITAVVLTLQPGEETGWHTHGVPVFGHMLEGELTVAYAGMQDRMYRAGDSLLEAMAVPHNGRNTGKGPMRILAVFMGTEGAPNSTPSELRN